MTHDDAWSYITRAYAEPGAAAALLARQDDEGLDVLLHLFTQWAAHAGKPLDEAALHEAQALVRPWRDEVVRPLRALRRAMKTMDAEARLREPVRARVQAAELAAERAQLDMLCDWLALR